MVINIILDPVTKKFTQTVPKEKTCYICESSIFIDDHHIDLRYGEISEETVPLCRRCHHTIGMWGGIHMFDDAILDKAIEVWNMTQVLFNRPLMTRENIKRSAYWNKQHNITKKKSITLDSNSKKFTQGKLL